MFLAELGLDGRLRPVPGVLPAVAAAERRLDTVVVAAQNVAEAALVPGVTVVGGGQPHRGDRLAARRAPPAAGPGPGRRTAPPPSLPRRRKPDLADVLGQAEARLALEICAAGGHHLSLLGPPGSGQDDAGRTAADDPARAGEGGGA